VALPEIGEGYIDMFRESDRFWGTSQMINMIVESAADMEEKYPGRDRLQVEDLGKKESMRHVENHQDHMHVRIRCPKGPKEAKKCVISRSRRKSLGAK
jgi:murein endopeptidase